MVKSRGKYLQISMYLLLLVALVFIMGMTRNCSRIHGLGMEGNSGGDTIDIAIIFGPNSLYLYNDTLGGLNREIALNFSHDADIPVKIWPVGNLQQAMLKLENGTFDILASIPLDHNIKKKFPASESLFLDRLVLVQLIDSLNPDQTVSSSLDLNGKTVFVSSGSPAEQRLKNLAKEIGGEIEIKEARGLTDELLCIKVASGSLPFAVVNEKTAASMAHDYPDLSFDNPVSFSQFQVWLFNPRDTLLLETFNAWFKDFKTTPVYQSLLENY